MPTIEMNITRFQYADYQQAIKRLTERARVALRELPEEQYRTIRDYGLQQLEGLSEQTKLTIAFVGQYSAGKSTIISALTGRDDIAIGQGVVTDKPEVYEWNQVLLVDTPGIYADRPRHDELSLQYMDEAHLLVYVVTINGFEKVIGENFRRLAVEEGRAGKMMLVMNKRALEQSSNEEGWKESLRPVVRPISLDELRLSIIDAEEYVESQDEPEEFASETRALSHFDEFVEGLNDLIAARKLHGKLLAPLNVLDTTISEVVDQVSAASEEAALLQEALRRKAVLIRRSRNDIAQWIDANVDQLRADILKAGESVVDQVGPEMDADDLKSRNERTADEIEAMCKSFNRDFDEKLTDEVSDLLDELEALSSSELMKTLEVQIDSRPDVDSAFLTSETTVSSGDLQNVLRSVGSFLETRAVGDATASGLRAASGSDLHGAVKKVGGWVGHKFKPWGAVKAADKIGKAGKVLGVASALIRPALDLYDGYQRDKQRQALRELRTDLRDQYRRYAESVSDSYEEMKSGTFESLHDKELEKTRRQSDRLRGTEEAKTEKVKRLKEIQNEVQARVSELQ